jgi:hypothetical protein
VTSRLERIAIALLFLGLFVLLVGSNQLDWDQFLSFFEVDRRAWLIDHAPPRWSYQLCAGASRLGDPQAFGLSPLFLPVLLLGTFWGSKILALASVVVGWLALRAALGLLFPVLSASLRGALALFFVFGDYFLWHLHAGHLTFALVPLSLTLFALGLRAFRGGLSTRDATLFVICAASILSAGFYPVVVFFLIPVGLCMVVPAAVLVGARPDSKSALRLGVAVVSALALSAHKWLGVLAYQRKFPRTLDPARHVAERALSPLQTLAFQISPTIGHEFWWAPPREGSWDVWEYAASSAISVLALAIVARLAVRRGGRSLPQASPPLSGRVAAFFAVALVGYISLTLEEDSPLSLHHLLNQVLYQGSVRVIGRYAIVLQLLALLWVAYRLSLDEVLRAWTTRWLVPIGYAVCVLNLATVLSLMDRDATTRLIRAEHVDVEHMQIERFVRPRTTAHPHERPYRVGQSYMFPAIARGEIVPNCYQPLPRPRAITTEARVFGVEVSDTDAIELVDPYPGPVDAPCRHSVSVTQQAILFDGAACPSDLCLNLNAVNLDADDAFALDEERGKYCRKH